MINNIFIVLRKPFPFNQFRHSGILMGGMIFLILAIFHPFGLHSIPPGRRYLIEFGFGFITFCIVIANTRLLPVMFPDIFSEEQWKVYKEILFILYNILIIAIINTVYLSVCGFIRIDLVSIIVFIFYTLIVATFPVFLLILIKYNQILKQNLKDAATINSVISEGGALSKPVSAQILKFTGHSEGDYIEVESNQVLYIQSRRNYLEFFYFFNDSLQIKLIRATLKELESSIGNFDHLQRCHRSYIVNINQVKSISGDSLGYTLHLENTDCVVPVSRTYTKLFRSRFIKR